MSPSLLVSSLLVSIVGIVGGGCGKAQETAPHDSGTGGTGPDSSTTQPDGGKPSDAGAPGDAREERDAGAGSRFTVAQDDIEIVGPFASWGNVVRDYGAAGDGVTDDTTALQKAVSDLGTTGKPVVLYLPAGNYKITSSLTFNGAPSSVYGASASVRIIGADPTTTKITWAGPQGDAMFIEYGGYGTAFSRITWDGQTTAGFGIVHWFNTTQTGTFYDGSTEDEDEVFQDMSIGIMAGRLGSDYGQLNSEGVVRRVTFLRNTFAGFDTGSFNALDWWIYDSQFIDCERGVTNEFAFDDNTTVTFAASGPTITVGAGAMYVYRSFFRGSIEADVAIGNTGWFSMHQNVSIGSRRFFESAGEGTNPAPTIIEGNRIIGTTDPATVSNGNEGPVLLIDNQIQSRTGTVPPIVTVTTDWIAGRDVLSIGNEYTVANPIQDTDAGADRHVSIDDTTVAPSAISSAPLTIPKTPAWSNRKIFDVAAGAGSAAIQSVINAAVAAAASGSINPVVHLPPGNYSLTSTLVVPKESRIQISGDSLATVLTWQGAAGGNMVHLEGPSYATVRDIDFLARTPAGTAIVIDAADQEGGRVFLEGNSAGPVTATNLEKTTLETQANPYIDELHLTNVQSCVVMSTGPIGPVTSTTSNAMVSDSWYEGTESDIYRVTSGTFTYLGGEIAPATHTPPTLPIVPAIALDGFEGKASFVGVNFNTIDVPANGAVPAGVGIYIGAETSKTSALFLGITDLWDTAAASSSLTPFYFDRTSSGGSVGLYLSKAPIEAGGTQDTPNLGTVDTTFVLEMLAQARSLTWDAAPYAAPSGATDVRIYRVGSQNTTGFVISGM
jgi:hypothetical protein